MALCADGGGVKKCVKERKRRHFSHPHFAQLEHFAQPPRSDRTFIFLGFCYLLDAQLCSAFTFTCTYAALHSRYAGLFNRLQL